MIHEVGGSIGVYLLLKLVEAGLVLGMTIYWLSCMHRVIQSCHPLSRISEPGQVWLTLIPIFGLAWQFISVVNTSSTVAREYQRRGWHLVDKHPTMELGIVSCIATTIVFLARLFLPLYPIIGFLGTLIVCFFMWRHTEELVSFRERPEKEMDPTTAFGQIPYAQQNNFTQFANPYQQFPQQQMPSNSYPPPYQPVSQHQPDPFSAQNQNNDYAKKESEKDFFKDENPGDQDTNDEWKRWAPKK